MSRSIRPGLAIALCLTAGCAETLEGPTPVLAPAEKGRPADPAYVCAEQLVTPVTLHGESFAPLVVGLPGETRTVLPTVTMTRTLSLPGDTEEGPEMVFTGAAAESVALTWQSQAEMTMTIAPELTLPPGLYDLRVENPQGAHVEQLAPIAVADAPELGETTPGITCLAQGDRPLTASGVGFLVIDGVDPTVTVGEVDLPVSAMEDCVDIAHPSVPGRLCATAQLVLPQDVVPPGYPGVIVNNPETAACKSEETVNLRVAPPPSLERIDPPLACPVEGPRDVVLHGADFLTIDGVLPGVTMTLADGSVVDLEVSAADGCEPLETTGHEVRRCTMVSAVVPAQAIVDPYKPTIELTNPAPAGCLSASSVALTLVPLPTVNEAAPPLACTAQGDRDVRIIGRDLLRVDGEPAAVAVDGRDVEVLEMNGCVDLEVDGLFTERCEESTVRVPEGHPLVAAGSFSQPSIRVENPAPAGCSIEVAGPLTVTPPPVAETLTPPVICLEQGAREVLLAGSGLLDVAGAVPEITVGGVAAEVSLGACEAVPVAGLETRSCAEATLTLAEASVEPGHHPVSVTNPDPAGCMSEEDTRLRVVPAPRIDRAAPPVACAAEGPREIVLEGADFLTIDDVPPAVTLTDADGAPMEVAVAGAGGCEPLEVVGAVVQRCTTVTIVVPQAVLADPYQPMVTLTNPAPAGCAGTASTSLLLTPPPTVAAVTPLYLCRNAPEVVVAVTGDFLTIDDVPPTVRLGDAVALAVVAGDCAPVPAEGAVVARCASLEASFAPEGLAAAEVLTVSNPDPAGCSATQAQRLVVLDPPVVRSAQPGLICTEDGARQVVVEGEGFLRIGGVMAQVRIGEQVGPADSMEGCAPAAEGDLAWESCTRITATLPQGPLPEGRPLVEVIDPQPAGCVGGAEDVLTVPPPLAIAQVVPEAVCVDAGDRRVRIEGTGFLRIDGQDPTLTLGGRPFPIERFDGCAPLAYPDGAAEACTALITTVPQGALDAGDAPVVVANPAPSACAETAEGVFFIVPVPEIDSVEPAEVCEADVETFVIRGRNFAPISRVFLDGIPASAVRFVDEGTLEADFADGLDPGTYDVRVTSADGCEDIAPDAVVVHPTPAVFFVDPPIAYNGISIQVTIYTTGLDAAPREVALIGPDDQEVVLPDARPAPGRPNKILATVPAGLAVGEWTVKVESRLGCVGTLPGALVVTDDLRIGLSAIDPAYVSPTLATAVTVRAAPEGDEVPFRSTPRAYLNPNPPAPDAVATALRAVVFVEEDTLTAVVPPDLRPGRYDLIVVNPDATVGVMEAALTVTEGEPPVVDGVEPASLDGNGPQPVRIFGADFDAAGGVSVTATCRTPDGMEVEAAAPVVGGSITPTSVEAMVPADQFPAGSVCAITLTNADGASSRFSAISIKTPAQNLNDWSAASEMTTARRAPGLVAGRPTRTSRYLFAIGGDDGGPASALDTVEAASIDVFGDMGAWAEQRNPLPAPRTLAGAARLGDFVYLVGGNDGAGPVDSVLRARILDPLAGPEVTDITLAIEEGGPGIGAGLWHYRISAVYAADDAENPGGESLPGEVTVVQLPAVDGLQLTMTWEPVPAAVGYRVYRTAAAGDGVDTVTLLAEVDAPRYVEAGAEVGEGTPLPPGSLGVWHRAATLNTAREAAAVAVVEDGLGGWLYVLGGRGVGGVLDAYEVTRIDPDGRVGAPMEGAVGLSVARAEAQAMRMTHADAGVIAEGDTWLFVGPGRTDGGFSRAVDAVLPEADGTIAAFIRTDDASGDYGGYGAGAANGFLFIFGGRGGMATDGGISAELCAGPNDPGCRQAPLEPPDLRNWNALGVSLTEPRVFMGSAQESAFFFIAGGHDGMSALSTVDQTVQ